MTGFRLCKRERKQSIEVEFIVGGESEWTSHAGCGPFAIAMFVRVIVPNGVKQSWLERCLRIEGAERVFDKR